MKSAAMNSTNKSVPQRTKNNNALLGKWQLWVMIALPLIWYIVFCYVPMYGIQLAFKNYNPMLGYIGSDWAGLKYFAQFFSSYYWKDIVWNTVSISLMSIVIGFPIPILLALLVNEVSSKRLKGILQNITYIPHFISVVVLCGMMSLLLSPQNGVINALLGSFGVGPVPFLESSKWFKATYVGMEVWQESGWSAIIYIAALAGIDPTLYEAATMDGAGRFKKILHISIPSILPTIVTLLILRIGQIMSIGFEKAYLLQNALNMSSSEIISTMVYKQGILQGNISYATAAGLMNSVINLLLIIVANKLCKKFFETSLW